MKLASILAFIVYACILLLMGLQAFFNYRVNDKLSQTAADEDTKQRYNNLKYVEFFIFCSIIAVFFIQLSIMTFLPKSKSLYGLPVTVTYFK
jgi:ABC-type Fe3+ transport system permease subunit